MQPETRYARTGGVSVAYQVLGEGPLDLVVVPGACSNVEYEWQEPRMAAWRRRLARFSRLIVFDKRGTGLSDQVHGVPTLEERMDDVRAVMDAVGSERAVVMGVSEGGPMTGLFAATYPERTLGAIVYGGYAHSKTTPERLQQFADDAVRRRGTSQDPWFGDSESIAAQVERFVNGLTEDARFDRVLATVLFTDIVGATRRAAQLGDRAWRQLLDAHHALVRTHLARFRGREIDTAGDGFFATFDGPARAIRCARSLADAVRELGLEVRAGVHTGECELMDAKVGGIAVHVGARDAAEAGRARCSFRAPSRISSRAPGSSSTSAASSRSGTSPANGLYSRSRLSRYDRIAAAARSTRRRFAGSLSQPLAPDGCGSGTATASP